MAIIIGYITSVTIDGLSDGIQSVNWNINRQPNRLWELGSWDPYKTQVTATVTVSITTYAGVAGIETLTPSASCANSTAVKPITINATTCEGDAVNVNYTGADSMFITSYSYSKGDATGFGTESWSLQKWIDPNITGDEFLSIPVPTYVLQGRSEGSKQGDVSNLGVVMTVEGKVTGEQGSVSAGFPGIGNANEIELGLITQVGGGTLQEGGKTGNSSATIPHHPIYLG